MAQTKTLMVTSLLKDEVAVVQHKLLQVHYLIVGEIGYFLPFVVDQEYMVVRACSHHNQLIIF